MRFSDLKKIKAAAESDTRAAQPKREAPPAVAPPAPVPAAVPHPARETAVEAIPAPRPAPEPARQAAPKPQPLPQVPFHESEAKAKELYSRLMVQTVSFLKAVDQPYCEKYESVLAATALAAETLRNNPAFLGCTVYSTADDYLRGHTLNTFILALAMGLEGGLDSRELGLLGFCAMAHDAGMTEYAPIYNKAGRLNDGDFSEMSLHAEAGAAKLDRIVDLDHRIKERARRIILQTHERADGSGYPDRATGEDLDPLAQIISIADAYEAMTHPRAWREAIPPPAAVKELIEKEGRGFNASAVKMLIAVISIYPPGSLVKLSTGETARVLKVNRGLLSRPLVEIALAPDFSEAQPQLADLREQPLVSIDRGLTFSELEQANPAYAGRLELSRWWTDW